MSVLAQPEQNQVEFADTCHVICITCRRRLRALFRRDGVDLRGGNGDMIEPHNVCHSAIAFGIRNRQTTFVTEINMPSRPIGGDIAQPPVNIAWRITAGEHDAENPMLGNRLLCGGNDKIASGLFKLGQVVELVPACCLRSVRVRRLFAAAKCAAFLRDKRDQVVPGVGKGLCALALQIRCNFVVIDTGASKFRDHGFRVAAVNR